jgi:formate dehydrogenase accessory protein FdhD
MLKVEITRIDVSTKKASKMSDYVAEEKPLNIFLNRTHYATIFCSPSNMKELVFGNVLSEGILKSIEEVVEITLNEDVCHINLRTDVDLEKRLKLLKNLSRIVLSACGSKGPYHFSGKLPQIESNLSVKAEVVLDCVNRLNLIGETFRKTGGVHVAAICKSDGTLVAFAEDVGRHIAVDKVIGMGAMNRTDFGDCFLALSGRLTGDLVSKAARVGLPIIASLSAAIGSGISIANYVHLTLVGFVRGKRMNIYTFPERVCA